MQTWLGLPDEIEACGSKKRSEVMETFAPNFDSMKLTWLECTGPSTHIAERINCHLPFSQVAVLEEEETKETKVVAPKASGETADLTVPWLENAGFSRSGH